MGLVALHITVIVCVVRVARERWENNANYLLAADAF